MANIMLAGSKNSTLQKQLVNKQLLQQGVGLNTANSKNVFSQTHNPDTGADDFNRPIIKLPPYTGHQLDFGASAYTGLKANQITLKVSEASGGGTADTWIAFDADGLSGKANSTGVTVGLTSSTLSSSNGYTAMNKLYAQKHPLINRVRMSVDAKAQLDYIVTIQYNDENSNTFDTKVFTPSTAIVQEDQQTTIAEFGFRFAVIPNMVLFGKIDNNSNAGYNNIVLFTNDYIWDAKFVG